MRDTVSAEYHTRRLDLVDLVMELVPRCSRHAAECLLAHGQVSIDGYDVGLRHSGRWTRAQLYGRMLKAGRTSARIDGSRLMRDYEQLSLDADG